jgi:hypothetical protein
MNVRPKLALVMTSRQLLIAQVAVALCSGVVEQSLGDWEDYRVQLGDAHDGLGRRLDAARRLDEVSGVRLIDLLDVNGHPVVAVEVELTSTETRGLRVAIERLRGILARTGEFDGELDEDLDDVAEALV